MRISSRELREKWLSYYESKGHKNIGSVSLIGDGETGVMFNVAGMQPLMPYLLGEKEHEMGKRLCNIQGCIRTVDIDNVGDESHFTFFEMMGNWSLGDYFKREKVAYSIELLTKVFGLEKEKICSTVFAGKGEIPRDNETEKLLLENGIKKENIYFTDENWWNLEGLDNTPCGPDNEWFYPKNEDKCCETCDINCSCGRYVEIGNDVYMEYKQLSGGRLEELSQKNVDTGFGFERMLTFLNGISDPYRTDLFEKAIERIEKECNVKYGEDERTTRQIRIICDHVRTAVMLIGDEKGIIPSNVGAGYILRRLMRRAIRYIMNFGAGPSLMKGLAEDFFDIYGEVYPNLNEKKAHILSEIDREFSKFEKTLVQGNKEFEKLISNMKKFVPDVKIISGPKAFKLFDTFGFPVELTLEMAKENGFDVDLEGFNAAFKEHQEKSKISAGTFKGGLIDSSEENAKLHTATHLLLAALNKVLGGGIVQKGSNITPERLRFDFNYPEKLTQEQLKEIEDEVNKNISNDIPVVCENMTLGQARNSGATGVFGDKYGEDVSVYTIGDVSREICGGPHAKSTGQLGKFKIIKEESSSAGVRRIKAILEKSQN